MEKEKLRARLLKVLDTAPDVKQIMLSDDGIEEKRKKVRLFLTWQLTETFEEDPDIPPLEWVLSRDAIQVFRSILKKRNENLAGFSLLEYIDSIIHRRELSAFRKPEPGFFAELEHLLKGITGQAGIYEERDPTFLRHTGRRAARMRSTDLSRMAKQAEKLLHNYTSGLDDDVIRNRYANKLRIMDFFGATEVEWADWRWHVRNIIRDADTLKQLIELTGEEYEAVRLAAHRKIPFGITPYYLSLMDYHADRGKDYAVRAQVIPPLNYVVKLDELRNSDECSMDFMMEHETSPIEGVTRRYPMIVILKPFLTCPQICVYCQRNWEITNVNAPIAALPRNKLDRAIEWIAKTPEIREVLVTGGDPFLLSNDRLENLLFRLSRIKHVERIRIGTRTPVTLPQRITDSLARDITHFHNPGKREILLVTHFEHPYEITPDSMEAVQKFRRYGIEVYNQLVYTYFNSKKFEACALRLKLRLIGVTPYYTFNTKGKEETDEYRVPIARLLQEQKEEARLLPGTVRTDEVVFNVPRLGKNYLRAEQHHDIISFLPDGRRIYEFHPWEKKLSLVDTYLYTDVSIYKYLKRLRADGEDVSKYRSIWYYY